MSNKIVFKKLTGTTHIWHKDTGLVVRSPSDKVVIGRYIDNEITPLDEEGIELCNKMKFKYELPEDEDEEEVEETEEVVEEGETEEVDEEESSVGNEAEVVTEEVVAEEVVAAEEEAVSEEVVETQEEVKPVVVVKNVINVTKHTALPGDSSKAVPLTHLTSEFTENLNKYFDSLNSDYSNKISVLETKLVEKSKESDNIKEKYNDMTDKYNKLEAKFNGIKQLFAV